VDSSLAQARVEDLALADTGGTGKIRSARQGVQQVDDGGCWFGRRKSARSGGHRIGRRMPVMRVI
jgi:hypothetical protein